MNGSVVRSSTQRRILCIVTEYRWMSFRTLWTDTGILWVLKWSQTRPGVNFDGSWNFTGNLVRRIFRLLSRRGNRRIATGIDYFHSGSLSPTTMLLESMLLENKVYINTILDPNDLAFEELRSTLNLSSKS